MLTSIKGSDPLGSVRPALLDNPARTLSGDAEHTYSAVWIERGEGNHEEISKKRAKILSLRELFPTLSLAKGLRVWTKLALLESSKGISVNFLT
ncbi:hypothetical protein AMTR_s00088p00048480 [Amborella trichopoda]|uniref:Uncharacterized protein n=1 Tax=Amborella trichopoda TaxID=13333 RepID=W1NRB5_AMBTC|nr:hypothetical protein AMTR_s00088p00048480 [Amborella trichopoda]